MNFNKPDRQNNPETPLKTLMPILKEAQRLIPPVPVRLIEEGKRVFEPLNPDETLRVTAYMLKTANDMIETDIRFLIDVVGFDAIEKSAELYGQEESLDYMKEVLKKHSQLVSFLTARSVAITLASKLKGK